MIPFYKPTIKRKDMDSVLRTMVDEKIGPGEKTVSFTRAFADTAGCSTAAAFRTLPDCIKSALSCSGAEPGDSIALSPLTPSVYENIIKSMGFNAVFVDTDPENGCPDEVAVSSSKAKVLLLYEPCCALPVKYDGSTSSVRKCDYSGIFVIEDITTSIGGSIESVCSAGDTGDIVICSLEDDSVVSAGGGAVLGFKDFVKVKKPGKYIRMPDINAALADVQLSNLAEDSIRRRAITDMYIQGLSRTNHRLFGTVFPDYESNSSCFCVFLSTKPDEILKFAEKHNVTAVKTFQDSSLQSLSGDIFSSYPHAAAFFFRCISFPVYPFLKNSEIESIVRVISHLP